MTSEIPYLPHRTSRSLQVNVTRVVQALMGISGMNQQDLVERLGIAQPTLSHKMNGRRRWSLEDLEILSRAFGVSPRMFLTPPDEIFGPVLAQAQADAWGIGSLPRVDSNHQPAGYGTVVPLRRRVLGLAHAA